METTEVKLTAAAAAADGWENIDLLLHGQLTLFFCSRSQYYAKSKKKIIKK
jgi:hypothetical protein